MPLPSVSIIDYRSDWTREYSDLASNLAAALDGLALRVDHVGSTSVPGLVAKDIIDVQVTVAALGQDVSIKLLSAGYTLHQGTAERLDHTPPGLEASAPEDWTKLFFKERVGQRRANVHVRQAGRPNQRYALLVRDFLRADPAVASAYGELKKRLASSLLNGSLYPDVKDPVSDIIYHAAERWAREVGWEPSA